MHSVSREPKGDVSWSCREIVELVVEESCSDDVEVDRAGRWSFFRSMSGRSGWAIAFVGRSGRDRTTFSKHGKTRREIAATMREYEKQSIRDFVDCAPMQVWRGVFEAWGWFWHTLPALFLKSEVFMWEVCVTGRSLTHTLPAKTWFLQKSCGKVCQNRPQDRF